MSGFACHWILATGGKAQIPFTKTVTQETIKPNLPINMSKLSVYNFMKAFKRLTVLY